MKAPVKKLKNFSRCSILCFPGASGQVWEKQIVEEARITDRISRKAHESDYIYKIRTAGGPGVKRD
jgi:hypothetical protein